MKPKDYKRIWNELKDSKIQKYIQLRNLYGSDYSATKICALDLEKMDELDGTNEFSNLLNDMGDK